MARYDKVEDAELRKDLDAYYECEGNKAEAARARGLKYTTYKSRLDVATKRLGTKLGKVVGGRVEQVTSQRYKLPKKEHVNYYILTSVQNNTKLHPGFNNLMGYSEWLDGRKFSSCKFMVGTFTYDLASYGERSVKKGKVKGQRDLWYAKEIEDYIVDESVELAPGLFWCGEQNILPTAKHPLTAMEDYNGRASNLVPHTKIAMESVPSMADEATKFNYSTGAVTQRNYIQKRAGIIAEQNHDYGALIVCVDSGGNWWVRQLYIGPDDEVLDVGPPDCIGVRVQAGSVTEEHVTEGINWGDIHASEMELWVRELAWGEGGMLDMLQPSYQFMNDLYSMRSRTHHEMRDFHRMYEKHNYEEESVEDEITLTADFLVEACRDDCETVVVPSNHDRHLDRWLNEADFRLDPLNARFFCAAQYAMLTAIDTGDRDFNILEWAIQRSVTGHDMLPTEAASKLDVRFLATDESFVIGKRKGGRGGVECGLHGDLAANGARGSTQALTKLGRALNKGHDHAAAIRGRVFSAGACALNLAYMRGPNSQSVSHIVTYKNAARAIITMWNEAWRT
jgi:hypothetical protein